MNNLLETVITDLSHDGRGVGHTASVPQVTKFKGSGLTAKSKSGRGKACFVAGALPGETVRWKRTGSKRSFDEGVLVDITEKSEFRVCLLYTSDAADD